MKKIALIPLLILAFSFTITAQNKKNQAKTSDYLIFLYVLFGSSNSIPLTGRKTCGFVES